LVWRFGLVDIIGLATSVLLYIHVIRYRPIPLLQKLVRSMLGRSVGKIRKFTALITCVQLRMFRLPSMKHLFRIFEARHLLPCMESWQRQTFDSVSVLVGCMPARCAVGRWCIGIGSLALGKLWLESLTAAKKPCDATAVLFANDAH